MRGNDYLTYLTEFQQAIQENDLVDETTVCALFAKGLSPYLQYVVLGDGEAQTFDEMKKRAWKAHSSVAPPWLAQRGNVVTQLGPVPMDLDLMKEAQAGFVPTPPVFAGPSILRENQFPAVSELDQLRAPVHRNPPSPVRSPIYPTGSVGGRGGLYRPQQRYPSPERYPSPAKYPRFGYQA